MAKGWVARFGWGESDPGGFPATLGTGYSVPGRKVNPITFSESRTSLIHQPLPRKPETVFCLGDRRGNADSARSSGTSPSRRRIDRACLTGHYTALHEGYYGRSATGCQRDRLEIIDTYNLLHSKARSFAKIQPFELPIT